MNEARPDRRLWFVVDELDAVGQIDGLKDALARLRKFGGRCVLGFQSVAQVSSTYGNGDAHTLVENCANSLILRSSASEGGGTARFASNLIGDREILRTTHSRSRRPLDLVGVRTSSQQVAVEAAILPSQIEQLPDLAGYLKVASRPEWLRVRLTPTYEAARENARRPDTGAMKSEAVADGAPVELGRILETVHAQQSQLYDMLASLETRSRDLDASVGEAVQRALTQPAGLRATEKLVQVQRASAVRLARWSFGVVSGCALVPALLSWMLMPSRTQLLQARQSYEQLLAGVAQLSREGGRIELRHCGAAGRLCVRVDRKSPFYGESGDFMVLRGY